MNFINILAQISTYLPIVIPDELNFIGKYIGWLITITGSVGFGVILFTLNLKLIVLPFDIFSKVKMKQNAVKMEAMRPELEKLQKQYANDKNLYNQKMLALQKKNGYSALSGCLPMILSIIIFMIAINAFRDYSGISMANEYNAIVSSYNQAVEEVTLESGMFNKGETGVHTLDVDKLYGAVDGENKKINGYELLDDVVIKNGEEYTLNVTDGKLSADYNEFLEKVQEKINDSFLQYSETDGCYLIDYRRDTDKTHEQINGDLAVKILNQVGAFYIDEVIYPEVNGMVKDAYESGEIKSSSFLWVKNVWMPDVSYRNPISSHEELETEINNSMRDSCSCSTEKIVTIDKDVYERVTAGLSEQKSQPNGYFIFIALSIIVQFLSQFVMQKMQKSQLELQSVDGQAAMTQKMMMWMMPIMFGFFAFSYSTAFSIYMTISSIVSTVSGILINLAVEKKYGKPVEITEGRSKKVINKIEQEKVEAEKKAKEAAEEKAKKKQERKNKKN